MSRPNPVFALLALGSLAIGCQTTQASSSRDTSTDHVGKYSASPDGITHPRVGIPSFEVSGKDAKKEMSSVAADQISTLLVRSRRFKVIERSQLDRILEEQSLGDMVSDGQLAQAGEINGVDYLLIGKVTNLSSTGLFIQTQRQLRPGKLIAISVRANDDPETSQIGFVGEVTWKGRPRQGHGFGVRFVHMTLADHRRFRSIVASASCAYCSITF